LNFPFDVIDRFEKWMANNNKDMIKKLESPVESQGSKMRGGWGGSEKEVMEMMMNQP
jgi:hypothetical protein